MVETRSNRNTNNEIYGTCMLDKGKRCEYERKESLLLFWEVQEDRRCFVSGAVTPTGGGASLPPLPQEGEQYQGGNLSVCKDYVGLIKYGNVGLTIRCCELSCTFSKVERSR